MTAPFLASGDTREARFPPWAWPLVPIAISGFFVSALTWFRLRGAVPAEDDGPFAHLVIGLYGLFGFEPLFMMAVLVLAWSSIAFLAGRVERPWTRIARIGALGLCLSILVSLRMDGTVPASAGEIGAYFASRLSAVLGTTLSILLVSIASLASLVLATDFFFYRQFEGLAAATAVAEPRPARPAPAVVGVEQEAVQELESLQLDSAEPSEGEDADTIVLDDDDLARAVDEVVSELERRGHLSRDEPEVGDVGIGEVEEPVAETADLEDEAAGDGPNESAPNDVELAEDESAEVEDEEDEEDAEAAPTDATWAEAEEVGVDDEEEELDEDEFYAEDLEDDVVAEDGLAAEDELAEDESAEDESAEDEPADEESEELDDALDEVEETSLDEVEPEQVEEPVEAEAEADDGDRSWIVPRPAAGQRTLFASGASNPDLVEEARALVLEYRRASVTFLKRRLRISHEESVEVLGELARQGVVEWDAGATNARVVGGDA